MVHVKDVRDRIVALLEDDDYFKSIPVYAGPSDLVHIKFPCVIVGITAYRLIPIALGNRYDRYVTIRIDCFEKEYDPEKSMEKVEEMAEKVLDLLSSNYSLSRSGEPLVRLAGDFAVTYDLVTAGETVLRNAGITLTTEVQKE